MGQCHKVDLNGRNFSIIVKSRVGYEHGEQEAVEIAFNDSIVEIKRKWFHSFKQYFYRLQRRFCSKMLSNGTKNTIYKAVKLTVGEKVLN